MKSMGISRFSSSSRIVKTHLRRSICRQDLLDSDAAGIADHAKGLRRSPFRGLAAARGWH